MKEMRLLWARPFPLSRVLARGTLISLAAFLMLTLPTKAQTPREPVKPYASMNRNGVYYAGTGAAASHDLHGNDVTIGMILPLEGPLAPEGKVLLQAAQMAIDEEAKTPLPGGQRLTLAVRDESGPWGQASDEIVRLIFANNAVAIITSPEGTIAHQAEQIANKIGVPVLTLSSDATTTQINMPWIFRLGPSDEDEARAFARDIYTKRKLRKVLLVAEEDHDGRVGADEFERAARELGAAAPARLDLASSPAGARSIAAAVEAAAPDAIVLWTDDALAAELIERMRRSAPQTPMYLCRKATEFAAVGGSAESRAAQPRWNGSGIWISVSRPGVTRAQRQFEKDFLARTETQPTEAAAAAYDAVHLIAAALRSTGANRVRVRDVLASGNPVRGATGTISFDTAGNERGRLTVVALGEKGRDRSAF
jgi:branched-chain amino acid transport system substrate-binding protein